MIHDCGCIDVTEGRLFLCAEHASEWRQRSRVRPTLTRRQREILDFIVAHRAEHGYSPSYEEIGNEFYLFSLATVHEHVHNLRRKGYLRIEHNMARSLDPIP